MKKNQKNLAKNKTSETINNFIPYRNPDPTKWVWNPKILDSILTSRHHWIIIKTIKNSLMRKRLGDWEWNQTSSLDVITIAINEANNGQGDSWTKWNGCRIQVFKRIYYTKSEHKNANVSMYMKPLQVEGPSEVKKPLRIIHSLFPLCSTSK